MAEFFRLPYSACRGEGEHACVIGPDEAVLVEITHGSADQQWMLASHIAALLNQDVGARQSLGDLIFMQVKPQ